jgi:hypothetical protein
VTKSSPNPTPEQSATRELLLSIMAERKRANPQESLADFGAVLARTIQPDRKPYSRQYIHMLRSGELPITPEIEQALYVLAAVLDGQSEIQARAHPVTVLAVHDLPPNTLVLATAHLCAWPGCQVNFVPMWPMQRYCPLHREAAAKRRRENYNARRRAQRTTAKQDVTAGRR